MSGAIYYAQECPTCGRNLQVRVKYLGKTVVCQHCAASFEAFDPSSGECPPAESGIGLLSRVDELIESAAQATAGIGLQKIPR